MENFGNILIGIAIFLFAIFMLAFAIDMIIIFFKVLFHYWYIPVGFGVVVLIGMSIASAGEKNNY